MTAVEIKTNTDKLDEIVPYGGEEDAKAHCEVDDERKALPFLIITLAFIVMAAVILSGWL